MAIYRVMYFSTVTVGSGAHHTAEGHTQKRADGASTEEAH